MPARKARPGRDTPGPARDHAPDEPGIEVELMAKVIFWICVIACYISSMLMAVTDNSVFVFLSAFFAGGTLVSLSFVIDSLLGDKNEQCKRPLG